MSILFTLVIVEAGLRILERLGYLRPFLTAINSAYTPFDVKTGEGLYYSHPYTAYDMKPGYGIPGDVTINSLGFRGKEFSEIKQLGDLQNCHSRRLDYLRHRPGSDILNLVRVSFCVFECDLSALIT